MVLQYSSFNDYINEKRTEDDALLYIVSQKDYKLFSGKNTSNIFCIMLNREKLDYWQYSVCDFILYTQSYKKTPVIISSTEAFEEALTKMPDCQSTMRNLRDYDPEVFIHSTLKTNWEQIRLDGHLYSWSYLAKHKKISETAPIGQLLGDPKDYSEFIMLGHGQSIGGEYVVMSKQAGYIKCMDDEVYEPGVRLYFDGKKLAKDGKLLRDGIHYKVKDAICLNDYFLEVIDESQLSCGAPYTPSSFSKESNQLFGLRRPEYRL